MTTIKKIHPWSFAKVYCITMAIVGFVFGLFFALVSKLAPQNAGLLYPESISLMAIIVLPILYGLMGLVIGAISAWLYNLAAKFVGGIEVEFDKK